MSDDETHLWPLYMVSNVLISKKKFIGDGILFFLSRQINLREKFLSQKGNSSTRSRVFWKDCDGGVEGVDKWWRPRTTNKTMKKFNVFIVDLISITNQNKKMSAWPSDTCSSDVFFYLDLFLNIDYDRLSGERMNKNNNFNRYNLIFRPENIV